MTPEFYIMCEPETSDAFFVTDDDANPRPFDTEDEAIASAREFSCTSLVLKSVARVTEVTKYKVERLK